MDIAASGEGHSIHDCRVGHCEFKRLNSMLIVDCFTFQIQTEIQISALVISGDIRISACRQPIEVYYGSF